MLECCVWVRGSKTLMFFHPFTSDPVSQVVFSCVAAQHQRLEGILSIVAPSGFLIDPACGAVLSPSLSPPWRQRSTTWRELTTLVRV